MESSKSSRRPRLLFVMLLVLLGFLIVQNAKRSADEPRTRQVSAQVMIFQPQAAVWRKLRDLTLADQYVPGIIKTEITTEQKTGVGASRKVFESETSSLDETVVAWEEGNGFVLRLHRGEDGAPFPFSEASFLYWVEDAGGGATNLTVSLQYVMRWGALGRLLDERLLRKSIRKRVAGVSTNLKAFYETGESVHREL